VILSLILQLSAPAAAGGLSTADVDLDGVYQPRRVALLVGVDHYTDPDLPPLRFSAKDASDLGDALGSEAIGNFDRVWVLTAPEETTYEGIARALDIATADLQRDDTFLLYLSGHGTLTLDPLEGTRLWFLPSDSSLAEARETGIAVAALEERVAEVPARRRVLVMDTCHNGREKSSLDGATARLLEGLRGDPPPPRTLREVSESEARLYAAQYHQPALEDPNLENGVYTHFLLEALTEPDRSDLNGDGLVDVAEAHDWAQDHTVTYTGGMQVPRAEYRIVGREEIFLSGDPRARSDAERALLAATDALLAGARVLVDGVPRGVLPDVVPIEPGRHTIELQDARGRTLLQQGLTVSAGETLMAEDLLRGASSGIELSVGGVLRQSGSSLHTFSPQLELTWLDPLRGAWITTDLHLRASGWRGDMMVETYEWEDDQLVYSEDYERLVLSGVLTPGLTVGWRATDTLSLNAVAEAAFAGRSFEDLSGALTRQGFIAPSLGPRLALRVPLGDQHLSIRYDLRYIPQTYAGDTPSDETEWRNTYEQGFSVGLGARR